MPSVTRKRNPTMYHYTLDHQQLKQANAQKDLGVIVTDDLKWRTQIHRAGSKGYKMLGFLQCHVNKDFDINCRKTLYLNLIRPTVGYVTQVGSIVS